MSCSCNCNPCTCEVTNCCNSPCVVQLPDTDPVAYTFENANLMGVGVLHAVDGTLVQFRGIVSTSPALNVTLDSPNAVINIDFDGSLLIAEIPTASETERGIAEVATQAETNAGIVDNVIVTPAKLAGRTATETRTGILEIATQAEVTTGTDDTRAVTPLKLATFAAGQLTTRTFADGVARGGATPAYDGQMGVQLDINVPFVANGTGVGDFDVPVLIDGANTLSAAMTIANAGFNITHTGAGAVVFDNAGGVSFTIADARLLANTQLGNGSGEFVNFEGAILQINGGTVTDSLLGTDNTGFAVDYSISLFLSQYNTQTGYTTFSNPATIRTCDTATVTLQQLAQLVGTLINDLKARLLPTT